MLPKAFHTIPYRKFFLLRLTHVFLTQSLLTFHTLPWRLFICLLYSGCSYSVLSGIFHIKPCSMGLHLTHPTLPHTTLHHPHCIHSNPLNSLPSSEGALL